MSEEAAHRQQARALLAEFARTGFARTSMAALASSISVARQTMYNRFGDKEGVLRWASEALIADLRRDALERLSFEDADLEQTVFEALQRWLGPVVELMGEGPHAAEILGLGHVARQHSTARPLEDFATDFAEVLERQDVANAKELSYLVMMAAKGLLYSTSSTSDFDRGLARIVASAFGPQESGDR